jgi:RNA polymerase sigma-70 factor, ECF subfamily
VSADPSVQTLTARGELEALYKERYPRFLRVAVASLGDIERGRDAVHETFVRAIRSFEDFRGEGSLDAWVWRILVNVCLAEKRRQRDLAEYPEGPVSDGEPVDWPEVRAAIAALPERQRTTLFLRHYADLDYDQIGLVLGVARGTVAASLHAAHSRLRDVLSGEVKP